LKKEKSNFDHMHYHPFLSEKTFIAIPTTARPIIPFSRVKDPLPVEGYLFVLLAVS
jgi:hypothetical protein